jgi:hypothetical protein
VDHVGAARHRQHPRHRRGEECQESRPRHVKEIVGGEHDANRPMLGNRARDPRMLARERHLDLGPRLLRLDRAHEANRVAPHAVGVGERVGEDGDAHIVGIGIGALSGRARRRARARSRAAFWRARRT